MSCSHTSFHRFASLDSIPGVILRCLLSTFSMTVGQLLDSLMSSFGPSVLISPLQCHPSFVTCFRSFPERSVIISMMDIFFDDAPLGITSLRGLHLLSDLSFVSLVLVFLNDMCRTDDDVSQCGCVYLSRFVFDAFSLFKLISSVEGQWGVV